MSSLRSLFEETRATTAGPSPRFMIPPSVNRIHEPTEIQTFSRASLDVPRTQSPWSIDGFDSGTPRKGTPAPPVPRPRRPLSRILPRPSSTTSLSAPRSPPTVIVDSPISPPKPFEPVTLATATRTSSSRSPPPKTPHSNYADADIDQNPHQKIAPYNPGSEPETEKGGAELTPMMSYSESGGNVGDIKSPSRIFPPPVNRAEKPRVPLKPATVPPKASKESTNHAIDERVSPFSSPPSSDENPDSGTSKDRENNPKGKHYIRTAKPMEITQSHPTSSLCIPDVHQIARHTKTVRTQGSDPVKPGNGQMRDLPHKTSETRPALPPRRVGDPPSGKQGMEKFGESSRSKAEFPLSKTELQAQPTIERNAQYLPPPKRIPKSRVLESAAFEETSKPSRHGQLGEANVLPGDEIARVRDIELLNAALPASDYPDISNLNRRPPVTKLGRGELDAQSDTRLIDVCGRYVVSTGHFTKIWDVLAGDLVLSLSHIEKEIKMTSLAFKPATKVNGEGSVLWLGSNFGDIQEIDITSRSITSSRVGAHERREIIKIHRHQSSMWTLDDGGRLCIWPGSEVGPADLQCSPSWQKVPRGHVFSIVILENLWLATGKEIGVFRPGADDGTPFSLLGEPLSQPSTGIVTSGAVIGGQLDRVYFGHACGKITIYSVTDFTCLSVVGVSTYKIHSLAGAGFYLWAGFGTGNIQVYDTRLRPWVVKKDWVAHDGPAISILVDRSSLWKEGILRVTSLGADNALRFWDGTLEDDWLGKLPCKTQTSIVLISHRG